MARRPGLGFSACAVIAFLLSFPALGAPNPTTKRILRDIHGRAGSNFLPLIQKWQDEHGARAVPELLAISRDAKLEDSTRYIALLAATKIGGQAAVSHLYDMLDDRSWMLRSAALRGLMLLRPENPTRLQEKSLLDTLRDKALVVRREAVEAVAALKPRGSVDALLQAAAAQENYVRGRAQWIPQSALKALEEFRSEADQEKLRQGLGSFIRAARDPAIRVAAINLRRRVSTE
jgi:HEAT repeat protein